MLNLKDISIAFEHFSLSDISLDIESGSYFILVGPTGSGKTLLLETIAGLLPAHGGRIFLDGMDITDLEPQQRHVGLVFQDYALFPHLSVRNNIAFGLRLRKTPRAQMVGLIDETAALVRIQHLLDRRVGRLSGGEKQKVALARSLILRPDVLLLDEPLSALDPESREALREDLRRLHRHLKNTIVHVTHDFQEALALADRIAVLGEGKLQQVGTPSDIFRRPASVFVARFTMTKNIFRGEVRKVDGRTIFSMPGAEFEVPDRAPGPCFVAIRPENVRLSAALTQDSGPGILQGAVTSIADTGALVAVTVDSQPAFYSLLAKSDFERRELQMGQRVRVTFERESVVLLGS